MYLLIDIIALVLIVTLAILLLKVDWKNECEDFIALFTKHKQIKKFNRLTTSKKWKRIPKNIFSTYN